MLRETITEADLAYHWNNNPLFRSAASQRILYQAAKYEMSQKGIATKAVREVPQVQRPGSPLERPALLIHRGTRGVELPRLRLAPLLRRLT